MHRTRTWLAALCAGLTLMAAVPAAQAQNLAGSEARATGSVNVRTGPGTGFAIVDRLQTNQVVQVRQCQSNWCYVEKAGPDGWVSASFLARIGGGSGGGWTPAPSPGPGPGGPGPGPGPGGPGAGNFDRQAQASLALNVRSGPGTQYRVVDTLTRGENVQVGQCRSNWCLIRSRDGTGWVSQQYLNFGGSGGGGSSSGPNVGFSISGPNFSFSIGTGADFGNRPTRPEDRGQVCFYEDWNYSGRSLCARPGDSYSQLGSFNDRISSIRIDGDIEVQVCEDANFRGRCAILNSSQRQLTGNVNDVISSFRVR